MRPSVSEQLGGIRHILSEMIAPSVVDPYAASILGGLMASLDTLAAGTPAVPAFLRWDAEGTAHILTVAIPYLPQEMMGEIRNVLAELPDKDGDGPALEARHERLRAALEQAAPAMYAHPESRSVLLQHLRERIARYPFVAVPTAPAPKIGGSDADTTR